MPGSVSSRNDAFDDVAPVGSMEDQQNLKNLSPPGQVPGAHTDLHGKELRCQDGCADTIMWIIFVSRMLKKIPLKNCIEGAVKKTTMENSNNGWGLRSGKESVNCPRKKWTRKFDSQKRKKVRVECPREILIVVPRLGDFAPVVSVPEEQTSSFSSGRQKSTPWTMEGVEIIGSGIRTQTQNAVNLIRCRLQNRQEPESD
ncbi:hypothetical protein GALMADRAFT_282713 [Galerina marginata CBS 339.88]|uniref:Uncharacterized protein n=1 Tax=Galerina marginata (strain CBS 339.88) TaxID=685588 RepID=A0A067SEA5_GALM3|nr:hypothetical protein GALMADRAFT_282713 [Galerina marginata CBS 339.88]